MYYQAYINVNIIYKEVNSKLTITKAKVRELILVKIKLTHKKRSSTKLIIYKAKYTTPYIQYIYNLTHS